MRQQEKLPGSRTSETYEDLGSLMFRGRDQVNKFTILFIFCFTILDCLLPIERILVFIMYILVYFF